MSNFNDEVCEYSYSSVTENFGYQSLDSCWKECEKSHESQDVNVYVCQYNCYRNSQRDRKPPATAGNSGGGGTIHF